MHLWSGLALPVPVLAVLAGRWRHGLRRDAARISRWTRDDRRWVRSLGPRPEHRGGQVQRRAEAQRAVHRRRPAGLAADRSDARLARPLPRLVAQRRDDGARLGRLRHLAGGVRSHPEGAERAGRAPGDGLRSGARGVGEAAPTPLVRPGRSGRAGRTTVSDLYDDRDPFQEDPVDVRIGVTYSPKELDIELADDADPVDVKADIEAAARRERGRLDHRPPGPPGRRARRQGRLRRDRHARRRPPHRVRHSVTPTSSTDACCSSPARGASARPRSRPGSACWPPSGASARSSARSTPRATWPASSRSARPASSPVRCSRASSRCRWTPRSR